MIRTPWLAAGASACFAGALAIAGPRPGDLREFASWLGRPAMLPFAWQAFGEASRTGNADETFARAQQILALVPSWTDGHAVFACQFVLDGDHLAHATADRAAAMHRRLQIALAWLEAARPFAGRREVELLERMAMLAELAAANEPGLAALLAPTGGFAAIADHYLDEAERAGAGPAVRENRTFRMLSFAAALLGSGDRAGALHVLDAAILRCADVRDQELATEWRRRLDEVRRHLRGESIDLTAVRADARLAPILPYLN